LADEEDGKMKLSIIILLVLLMLPGSTQALMNVSEILPNAMAAGADAILRRQADNLLDMTGTKSVNESVQLANTMIGKNDFVNNTFVQSQKDYTAGWFMYVWVLFALFGGVKLLHEISNPKDDYGRGLKTWRTFYLSTLLGSLIFYKSYLWGFSKVFDFEYVFSYGMFMQTMDSMPYAPSSGTAYFVYNILNIILTVFGKYRYIVLGIVTGLALLIYILKYIGADRLLGTIFWYSIVLLFGRTFLIAILWMGVGILAGIPDYGSPELHISASSGFSYTVVLIIDVSIAFMLIMYPIFHLIFGGKQKQYIII
jgi:hypothetical protein